MDNSPDGTTRESAIRVSPVSGARGEFSFDVAPGLTVNVRSASGELRVSEGATGSCRVHLTTRDPDETKRLATVECTYDSRANRVLIDTKAGQVSSGDGVSGFKQVLTRWIDNVRHDVDVTLELPAGSSVQFRTASGDADCHGSIAGLDVASASGDVSLGDLDGPLKFYSASGDIVARGVAGDVELKTVSGDVRVGPVGGDLNVQTVSGDVTATISSPVEAKVNTVSGDVQVAVRTGLLLEIDAHTISGELSSEIALDGSGSDIEPMLRLKIRTVSGDVVVRRD